MHMVEILQHPIDEPCVWKAAQYRDEQAWGFRFSDVQTAELEAAAEKVLAAGKGPLGFGREDFMLPTLGPVLDQQREILENGRGFIFLRGLDVRRYDDVTLHTIYWGICAYIGVGISQNAQGELLSGVTDYGDEYKGDPYLSNIRLHRTTEEIHPHTDSCDLVSLLCVRPAKSGGGSAVVSSLAMYNEILSNHPEYLEPLCEGFHLDLVGKGTKAKQLSFHRIPVFSYFGGKMSARYNKRQIELGAENASGGLDDLQQAAVDYVRELSMRDDFRLPMTFNPGDIQILNNRVTFHARTGFEDYQEPDRKRLLLRIWLNAFEPRPMAPEFANQLNTGERGGVASRA
jgi:hypothetical protein